MQCASRASPSEENGRDSSGQRTATRPAKRAHAPIASARVSERNRDLAAQQRAGANEIGDPPSDLGGSATTAHELPPPEHLARPAKMLLRLRSRRASVRVLVESLRLFPRDRAGFVHEEFGVAGLARNHPQLVERRAALPFDDDALDPPDGPAVVLRGRQPPPHRERHVARGDPELLLEEHPRRREADLELPAGALEPDLVASIAAVQLALEARQPGTGVLRPYRLEDGFGDVRLLDPAGLSGGQRGVSLSRARRGNVAHGDVDSQLEERRTCGDAPEGPDAPTPLEAEVEGVDRDELSLLVDPLHVFSGAHVAV